MTSRALIAIVSPLSVILVIGLPSYPAIAQSNSGSFSGMAGSWSGSGMISLADGSSERIRCRANYIVGSVQHGLRQSLRCASDSYKFELASDVVSDGQRISGSWSETTRGISGGLQGRLAGPHMTVAADAPGFSANISLATHGNRQSISISSAGDIRNVSISMVRH
ncbi:hypothetical protein AB8B21_27910 [Tardiphaga sp. 866_E4_N2_1]|uniref:hypothetical protein n=1 Tax=unclassified Tardiphaga TaxID=2631404 RepID=UPI003F25C7D3